MTPDNITVKYDSGEIKTYNLTKFLRSNQCYLHQPAPHCECGRARDQGQMILADGPATDQGEIALGQQHPGRLYDLGRLQLRGCRPAQRAPGATRTYIPPSILKNTRLDARDTKLGPEEITRDIPNVGEDALKDLDERGIIRIGAEVHAGDILVGKVTPKGETELTAEERLLRAIFGEKAREVRDTSLRVPHGEYGIVVDVKVFTRENGDELAPGVNMVVRMLHCPEAKNLRWATKWPAATATRALFPAFCRRRICPSCLTARRWILC